MFKKFINGLIFGAGFGIAFVLVVVIYFQFFFQSTFEKKVTTSNGVISTPPTIREEKNYLGSPAIYSGGFLDNRSGVLSGGDGEIIGKAILNNKPVSGLKLRLALNGSVMSQWATTDDKGEYSISVPYGEYKIDGFELDRNSSNRVLAGKIDHPQKAHSSGKFLVSSSSKGRGLTFKFIDPIVKKMPKAQYSASEDIVLHWEPYPGASQYTIQIYEKPDPHGYIGNKTIFDWSNRPRVKDNSFNLKKHGIKLKAGHFYVVEISADNADMGIISTTHRMHSGYDFEVTK